MLIAFQQEREHVALTGARREEGNRQGNPADRFNIQKQNRNVFFDPVDGGSHDVTVPLFWSMIVPAPSFRMAVSPLFP